MENYIVSARKYRPSTFNSVVGQKSLTTTLRNSISKDRLAHAYLFCGSRGVGKTSCARIFAKTINCEHRTADGEACNECASCREFNKGTSLNIIELDAASNNGVEAIRDLTDQVQVPPVNARYRVFIVDEVHMLSAAAFNAFLKTLEEPPSYVIFILATTEKHKILPTILSRCQIYDFNRITIQDMVDHLKYVAKQEGINTEDSALNVIARKADGAMRDALSIFDQVAASTMGNVTYHDTIENLNILDYEYYDRLVEAFLNKDVPTALLIYKEIRDKGFDSLFFINGLASHFRDLMVAQNPVTLPLLEASDDAKAAMAAVAQKCAPAFIYKAMDYCNEADLHYREASNKQFLVELTLIKLCQQLSPSPSNGGAGEGQLSPIAKDAAPQPQSQPAPAATAPQAPTPVQPRPTYPTATPAPAPRPAAPAARRTTISAPRLSINPSMHQSQQQTERVVSEVKTQRMEAFTDEDFNRAWTAIMAAHPTEHILINAMRISKLTRNGGNKFIATVESEAIENAIQVSLPMLHRELRSILKNDTVEIAVNLDKGQATATSLTDSELFAKLKHDLPEFAKFAEDLHLTLI